MTRRRRRSEEKRRRHGRKVASGAGITVGATLLMGGAAQAATFTVNSLADPGDPGKTTLHDAITQANALHQPSDKIVFASGLSGSVDLTTNLPNINYSLEIDGPGAGQLAISGQNARGIFHSVGLANPGLQISGLTLKDGDNVADVRGGAVFVAGGSPVTISDTVFAGNTAAEGGAIYALNGTLDIRRSTFLGNSASGVDGGGAISTYGPAVTISDSVISGNSAFEGAGIAATESSGGSLLIQRSTVSGNHAGSCCGGLFSSIAQTTQIRSSTISGNTVSDGPSGGMYVYGPLTVTGSTIAGNIASSRGGGVYGSLNHDAKLEDSIVAGNISPIGPDVRNVIIATFSLIGNASGATVHDQAAGSNLIGVDPQLSPLAQHGGPTPTMAPSATSPVIDKGAAFGLGTDQRGLPRPFDAPTIAGSTAPGADGSDIGAVELQASEVSAAPAAPVAKAKCKKKKKKHKRSAESAKKKKCKKKKKKKH